MYSKRVTMKYTNVLQRQLTRLVLPVVRSAFYGNERGKVKKWKPLHRKLSRKFNDSSLKQNDKITIVGTGEVAMATAIVCQAKRLTNNLILHHTEEDWATAERSDLLHHSVLLNNPRVQTCVDGKKTYNSRIIILTAGMTPTPGGNKLDLVKSNAEFLRNVVPKLAQRSPKAIFIVATHPADVMTYVTLKTSKFPKERVISTSCHLDTARFRYFIGERLGVAPTSVHGYIIGKHGSSCVPVWSSVNVGGVLLSKLNKYIGTDRDPEKWNEVHEKVVKAANSVIDTRGYKNFATGATIADVTSAIIKNQHRVMSLGIDAKGYHSINTDICLSLPCVIGGSDVQSIINLKLTEWEQERLNKSADKILKTQALTGV